MQMTEIAERYFAAWAARDPDAIAALHAEDSRFDSHGRGAEIQGREALRAEFAHIFELYPEFDFQTHRVLYGATHWTLDWTLLFRPPGELVRGFRCLDVVEVTSDGLVARKDTYFDLAEFKTATASSSSNAVRPHRL